MEVLYGQVEAFVTVPTVGWVRGGAEVTASSETLIMKDLPTYCRKGHRIRWSKENP